MQMQIQIAVNKTTSPIKFLLPNGTALSHSSHLRSSSMAHGKILKIASNATKSYTISVIGCPKVYLFKE